VYGVLVQLHVMYNSFELFFFWRKSGMVVAVGVPDFFFACGWIGLLIYQIIEPRTKIKDSRKFKTNYEYREAMCQLWVDCKKCDRKKTTAGLIVRRQAKRLCKPCTSTGSVAVRLNELTRKGEDFCLPVVALWSCP